MVKEVWILSWSNCIMTEQWKHLLQSAPTERKSYDRWKPHLFLVIHGGSERYLLFSYISQKPWSLQSKAGRPMQRLLWYLLRACGSKWGQRLWVAGDWGKKICFITAFQDQASSIETEWIELILYTTADKTQVAYSTLY